MLDDVRCESTGGHVQQNRIRRQSFACPSVAGLAEPSQHVHVFVMNCLRYGPMIPFHGSRQHFSVSTAGNDVDFDLLTIAIETFPASPLPNCWELLRAASPRVRLLGDRLED